MEKPPTRTLLVIALVAIAHAALFSVYQRPEWDTSWNDQVGYQRLGHVLATTGRFTRNPDMQPFVPETIRTPAYPLFVAVVYRTLGESHAAVAAAQAALFVLITLVVFALTSRLATRRVALAAAWFVALFPPIPYYGALVLTEVLCTAFVMLAVWTAVRALQDRRPWDHILTGIFIGLATLTRPTWALLPLAIVGCIALAAAVGKRRSDAQRVDGAATPVVATSGTAALTVWRTILPWGWMLVAFALVLAPWLAYNMIYVHRLTLSPAGGIGRATWEASWQGTWQGGVQADLTRLVEAHVDDSDADLDDLVRRFAADHALPAAPMLTYAHQWRDIRRIWNTPTDPRERAAKRIEADDEYWRVGIANIGRDRVGYVVRRVTTGAFVLWAAEVPIRFSRINSAGRLVIRAMWLVQAGIFALAIVGLVVLAHRRGLLVATPLGVLLVYTTAVHLPMLAEARYSLPAKPVVLALTAIALAELLHRFLPQTGDYLP